MHLGGVIHLNKTGIFCLFGILIMLIAYHTLFNDYNKFNNVAIKPKINLHQLLDVAIQAAENGGSLVVELKDNVDVHSKGLTKEGAEERVTTADYRSHCAMLATLRHFYPALKIVSEEASLNCEFALSLNAKNLVYSNKAVKNLPDEYIEEDDLTVWIDPLDATHEYTEKMYKFVTTMVCVAVKGKPIIGVINSPFDLSTSWAWVNKSYSRNLRANQNLDNNRNNLKVIVSRSHKGKIEEVLKNGLKKKYVMQTAAGAGYKALEVANNNADAYLHITAIKKWDICAGNAIINALGGKMTTKYNREIDYSDSDHPVNENGLIATMTNHQTFLDIF